MDAQKETTTDQPAEPQETVLQVVPVAARSQTTVTMEDAFMTLCRSLVTVLDAHDDLPGVMHAEEIMGWYTNGNTAIAWQHAVLLLEKAIQVPLRGMT